MNVGNAVGSPAPASSAQPAGEKLVALRALKKALEEDRRTIEASNDQTGKGQLLDIRC